MIDLEMVKLKKENKMMKETLLYLLGFMYATEKNTNLTEILANTLKNIGVECDYIEYMLGKFKVVKNDL